LVDGEKKEKSRNWNGEKKEKKIIPGRGKGETT
jgi:hypothetical protein